MTGRARIGLRAPAHDIGDTVATRGWSGGLWRAQDGRHPSPWWYACRERLGDGGRFDLDCDRGRGTVYWAATPAAALLEKLADPDAVEPPLYTLGALEHLRVWHLDDAAPGTLADTTVASVPGLTAEIGTILPYVLPQRWADAFDAAGLEGILYRARFANDDAVALFGPTDPRGRHDAVAVPRQALDHYPALPTAFRVGASSIGRLENLPRAPEPT